MTRRQDLAIRISNLLAEVEDDGPIPRSRSFLPISSTGRVLAGNFESIAARAQVPFRGDRLAVWSTCAPSFFIECIRVGVRVVGAAPGSAPADAFATRLDLLPFVDSELQKNGLVEVRISRRAEECFGQPLSLPRAECGTEVSLVVRNASDTPQVFVAVLLGDEER